MFIKVIHAATLSAAILFGGTAAADTWTLDSANSRLAFGSIKKNTVGEVHGFAALGGTVAADGTVALEIGLASVETNIEIRNERMNEHVFEGAPVATLSASMDMAELKALTPGGMMVTDVEGVLSFLGRDVDIETEMFVTRISETQVMVTTNDMLFISAEDLGISAGIDTLMALAKLPGITRTSPVTVRLVFTLDAQKAEATPAPAATQVAALTGDVKKGKRVFKKCKACHSLKEGRNASGPSLHGIMGAKAGAIDGFKYSDAMAESGFVWDAETLTAFLKKPKKALPGTKMQFAGLRKDADIENLLAYLANQ